MPIVCRTCLWYYNTVIKELPIVRAKSLTLYPFRVGLFVIINASLVSFTNAEPPGV